MAVDKPIAITMGCPVGVGPEIILKYYTGGYATKYPVVVVGDPWILEWCAQKINVSIKLKEWQPGQLIDDAVLPVMVPSEYVKLQPANLLWGKPDVETGRAMARYIEAAVNGIQKGLFSGLATCPITKAALQKAGYSYPGHTEMLASLCNVTSFAMMMAGSTLRITLVSIHMAFSKVASHLTQDKIKEILSLTHYSLKRDFGIKKPRIAVAGLNPHAGEGGLFGNEEKIIIKPAIVGMKEKGLNVSGPYPPDTVFNKAVSGNFDAVVCMYHDQGLIPFKLLHFSDGVNVTLGLPIVRTSVDHGTAYDIAGQGKADASSLIAAVDLAHEIALNRKRGECES